MIHLEFIIDQIYAFFLLMIAIFLWGLIWFLTHILQIFSLIVGLLLVYGGILFLLWLMNVK